MIGDVLSFLRTHLDAYLRAEMGDSDPPTNDRVVFVGGESMDPLTFELNAVTEFLINVEEERLFRSPDPYRLKAADGTPQRTYPELRLTLYILFVARFRQYEIAWQHLSSIIEHLQRTRVFETSTHPELPAGVERLTVELMTLGLSEQNDIWNALRIAHHPSVLYRVNLLALRDRQPQAVPQITPPVEIDIDRIP